MAGSRSMSLLLDSDFGVPHGHAVPIAKGLANLQDSCSKVDVFPGQPRYLSPPHPGIDCQVNGGGERVIFLSDQGEHILNLGLGGYLDLWTGHLSQPQPNAWILG